MISHFWTRHAFKCGPSTKGTRVIMMIRFYKKYTVEPLYKGQVGLSLIQWSLSTRDKLGTLVPYTVEPLYKGQVGDRGCPLLRGNKCTVTSGSGDQNLSFVQRLSTFCPLSKVPLYRFQWGRVPRLRGIPLPHETQYQIEF